MSYNTDFCNEYKKQINEADMFRDARLKRFGDLLTNGIKEQRKRKTQAEQIEAFKDLSKSPVGKLLMNYTLLESDINIRTKEELFNSNPDNNNPSVQKRSLLGSAENIDLQIIKDSKNMIARNRKKIVDGKNKFLE